MPLDWLTRAEALHRAGTPFALATVVRAERPTSAKAGAKAIVTADGALAGWVGGSCAQPTVIREGLKALRDGQPRLVRLCPPEHLGRAPQDGVVEVALTCISGGTLEVYIEPQRPAPHLVAVGHLPVVEALSRLGKGLGYRVTVLGLDASPERFPDADRVLDRLDFHDLAPSPQTYVVVATHGNYDEEALAWALNSDAGYVALVASRVRGQAVLQYLRETDVSEARLARLRCPAGLDLGAVAPEEIALSILAEIVSVRRATPPEPAEAVVQAAAEARDVVCGMLVEIASARYVSTHAGRAYYFCSAGCKRAFDKETAKFLSAEA